VGADDTTPEGAADRTGRHRRVARDLGSNRLVKPEAATPRREFLERIREAATLAATAAREISRATGIAASRCLDDIHIEAAAVLMRSRWKTPIWGPPEKSAILREVPPPPLEKTNERT